jgi:hypothetical protein
MSTLVSSHVRTSYNVFQEEETKFKKQTSNKRTGKSGRRNVALEEECREQG